MPSNLCSTQLKHKNFARQRIQTKWKAKAKIYERTQINYSVRRQVEIESISHGKAEQEVKVARASASDISRKRSTFLTAKPTGQGKLLERTFRKSMNKWSSFRLVAENKKNKKRVKRRLQGAHATASCQKTVRI